MEDFSDDEGSGLELVHVSDVLDYIGEYYQLWTTDFKVFPKNYIFIWKFAF